LVTRPGRSVSLLALRDGRSDRYGDAALVGDIAPCLLPVGGVCTARPRSSTKIHLPGVV